MAGRGLGRAAGVGADGAESRRDLLPAGSGGEHHVEQNPRLERVEEPGPDQAAAAQVR